MSKQFDSLKHPRMVYIVKENAYIYLKLGVTIRFGVPSSINNFDEMLGCESLHLIHVYSIKDGTLRFRHIVREEKNAA